VEYNHSSSSVVTSAASAERREARKPRERRLRVVSMVVASASTRSLGIGMEGMVRGGGGR
jgi:hypothetical protein